MGLFPLKFALLVVTLASTALTGYFLQGIWAAQAAMPAVALTALDEGAGTAQREPASLAVPVTPLLSLDEVYVSLGHTPQRSRSLVVTLELELFDESSREVVDRFRSAVRDTVLQSAMEQPYESLKTLSGKLYFKELLVGRVNALLNKPAVRDIHFGSFYLQ